MELFLNYYSKFYGEVIDSNDQPAINEKLLQLDFLTNTNMMGQLCTIAGELVFGKTPGDFLPQSGFRLIHYIGTQPEVNALSDEIITGPIAEIRNSQQYVVTSGLLARTLQKLQDKISIETISNDHVTRIRNWDYPPEVLRELLVNATIHRDYTRANQNRIEIFNDRIEITSFGRLPNTLTLEKIKAGQQYPRNPILIRVAKDFGFTDDRGLGIRRKVIPILKQLGYPEPVFEPTDDFFKVTIYKLK